MTAPSEEQILVARCRDLRQLAGAAAYALWIQLYVDRATEETSAEEELSALLTRNSGDLRLAAADLLDGLIDGAETIRKLKLEGELEVEFLPVQYATKSASLRAQVADAANAPRHFGPPLAGFAVSRANTPQVFGLEHPFLRPDRENP